LPIADGEHLDIAGLASAQSRAKTVGRGQIAGGVEPDASRGPRDAIDEHGMDRRGDWAVGIEHLHAARPGIGKVNGQRSVVVPGRGEVREGVPVDSGIRHTRPFRPVKQVRFAKHSHQRVFGLIVAYRNPRRVSVSGRDGKKRAAERTPCRAVGQRQIAEQLKLSRPDRRFEIKFRCPQKARRFAGEGGYGQQSPVAQVVEYDGALHIGCGERRKQKRPGGRVIVEIGCHARGRDDAVRHGQQDQFSDCHGAPFHRVSLPRATSLPAKSRPAP